MGKIVIIFEASIGLSAHIDDKNQGILIFGKGQIQGLDNSTLTAKYEYPLIFTQPRKRSELSL